MLFSHWAPGEPRNNHAKKCSIWRFCWKANVDDLDPVKSLIDEKWYSMRCGHDNNNALVCQRKRLPPIESLVYSEDFDSKSSDITTKGSFGELLSQESKERQVLTSMSSPVASGYLQGEWEDIRGTSVRGFVSGYTITFNSSFEQRDLLELLRPLFHVCETGQNQDQDQDQNLNIPQGVPLSWVCDGKRDCS